MSVCSDCSAFVVQLVLKIAVCCISMTKVGLIELFLVNMTSDAARHYLVQHAYDMHPVHSANYIIAKRAFIGTVSVYRTCLQKGWRHTKRS